MLRYYYCLVYYYIGIKEREDNLVDGGHTTFNNNNRYVVDRYRNGLVCICSIILCTRPRYGYVKLFFHARYEVLCDVVDQ